jgi:hypothetical protein
VGPWSFLDPLSLARSSPRQPPPRASVPQPDGCTSNHTSAPHNPLSQTNLPSPMWAFVGSNDSTPAVTDTDPPPLERHLNPTSLGMQRDVSISRASINSGSTSKRVMAPTTFESRGYYLGANQRRRQVLTQGVRCTPSELAGLRWRSSS